MVHACPGSARTRRGAVLLAAASLAGTTLTALVATTPAHAATDGSTVVISEVYGSGGNTGATYNQDFVELYNPTGATVDLSTYSVQYRSATGTANPSGVVALTGKIASHGHYLVGLQGGATGAALPQAPDQTDSGVNLSGSAGTVFLATQTGPLVSPPTGSVTGAAETTAKIADLLGYGTSNTYETTAAGAPTASTSLQRAASGTDSDRNSVDFTTGAPTPEHAGTLPPEDAGDRSIEEIQGSGSASPYANQTVHTFGVVTASYPTGGFDGFVIQTPGSGGDLDLGTHDTSDAVFVYLGSADASSAPQVGQYVDVHGLIKEFNGLTEISSSAAQVAVVDEAVAAPKPATVAWPRTDAQRESLESMLIDPQGDYTVADNYSTNQYAEVGLASGDKPLSTPTDVADPHDAAAIAAVNADNAARKLTLDDGATTNFLPFGPGGAKNTPLPWLTQDPQIRVGERAQFTSPMVVDYRNSLWKLQPTSQLTADGQSPVSFSHNRQSAPTATGGNLHIASFNVLNYFPTTGADWVADGGTCTWYDDRAGEHVTVNTCTNAAGDDGPRGAADREDFLRQQAKIVHAINHLGADVVSLEEIENSAKFGDDRDAAVSTLVDALNADAGAGTWRFVPTPPTAGDQSDEDVIRTAFIFKPASVQPQGDSMIDDAAAFDVARDPLAQGFRPTGGEPRDDFAVIVNHFKSKGSGPDDGTGQGNSNPQRVAQADELAKFANQVKSAYGTDRLFLSGDFNSYTREDPLQHLYNYGYADIGSQQAPDEYTYLFGGTVGSLDHVLANGPAQAMVTGAHVWNINSVESVALEYSRDNYNATSFYTDEPFRASDHDPLVVGINDVPRVAATLQATAAPAKLKVEKPWSVTTTVTGAGKPATGTVDVYEGSTLLGTGRLSNGTVTIAMPPYARSQRGTHTLRVEYGGDDRVRPGSTTLPLTFQ